VFQSLESGAAALDATRGLTAVAWCVLPPAAAAPPITAST
jgi:hypothetical protein